MHHRQIRILSLGSAVLLFLGVMEFPYGYYTFLRIFICIFSAFLVLTLSRLKNDRAKPFLIVFVIIAILWNPLIPVYLSKAVWIPLDLIGGLIFLIFSLSVNGVIQ